MSLWVKCLLHEQAGPAPICRLMSHKQHASVTPVLGGRVDGQPIEPQW